MDAGDPWGWDGMGWVGMDEAQGCVDVCLRTFVWTKKSLCLLGVTTVVLLDQGKKGDWMVKKVKGELKWERGGGICGD